MQEFSGCSFHYLCGAVAEYNAGTNDYYGSLSIPGEPSGAFGKKYSYMLHLIAEDKKPVKIIAAWHVGCYSFDTTPKEEITEKEFEASDAGTEEACNWLYDEYKKIIG